MDDFTRPPRRPKLQLNSEEPLTKEGPAFVPPEELAAREEAVKNTEEVPPVLVKPWSKKRINLHLPHGKKQWIITILTALLLLGGGTAVWWFYIKQDKVVPVVGQIVEKIAPEPEKPKTEPSKLSGLEVDPSLNLRPVTGVMIENSAEARPQSGLKEASVVFEAIAEGGITRFLALFQDTAPDYIGPIRSLRPYYIDWLLPFDGAIAHVGGSPQALSDVKSLKIKDLDQFANGGSYSRTNDRFAPHNVYTSLSRLLELQNSKGFTTSTFTGFVRKKETPVTTPVARSIDLNISSSFFNVHYDYDAQTNSYKRSVGGAVHNDEKSGTQLSPKVVVAIVMPRGIATDGQHTDYQTTGSGKVFIFQDGTVNEGTWSKTSRAAQWSFADASGNILAFNPGQSWISMVDTPGSVSFVP